MKAEDLKGKSKNLVHSHCKYLIKFLATYCPINSGYVCTSIIAHGLMGVWRLVHVEYSKPDGDILSDLVLDSQMFQPEVHRYFLIELSHGNYINFFFFFFYKTMYNKEYKLYPDRSG